MLIGKKLGPYKLTNEAGSGQMSTVYKAVDTRIGRTVAVKVQSVPPNLLPEQREALQLRMQREARTVGRISHPNVVQVFVAGVQDDLNYIAMEYLDGVTLQDRLDVGPLTPAEAAGILDQVAAGLEAVHAQGVVHRDIKPSNIMILSGGVVKLTDFGVAYAADDPALTTQGMMVGSPSYMSPEQANGQPATPASDIWSLGVLLYHMLTGKSPFAGQNVPSVLYKIVHEEPEASPLISEGVATVLRQALDKSADRRYPSPAALASAFRAALPDLTLIPYSPVPPPTIPPVTPEYASPVRGIFATAQGAFAPRVPRPAAAPPEARRYPAAVWQIPAVLALLALGGMATVISQRSWNKPRPVASVRTTEQQTASAALPEVTPQPAVTPPAARNRPNPKPSVKQVAVVGPKKNPVRIVSAKVTPAVEVPPPVGVVNAAKPKPAVNAAPTPKAPGNGAWRYGELLPPKPETTTTSPAPATTPTPRPIPTVAAAPRPVPSREPQPTPEPPRPRAERKTPPPIVVPDTDENEPPLAMPSEDNAPLPDAAAELRDLLGVWIAVTNDRDIDEQMVFYAPRLTRFYQARDVSRDAVRAEKERVFSRARRVKMNTYDLRTTFSADGRTAVTRFRKRYLIQGGPGERSGTVDQELRWQLLDDGWKIISERDMGSS